MDPKKARKKIDEKGLKHKSVAKRIGVTAGTLSRFLNGKQNLNDSAQILLSQILNDDHEGLRGHAS